MGGHEDVNSTLIFPCSAILHRSPPNTWYPHLRAEGHPPWACYTHTNGGHLARGGGLAAGAAALSAVAIGRDDEGEGVGHLVPSH